MPASPSIPKLIVCIRYREKLCLLQVSLPEGDFLVDPLAGSDLAPLANTLARKEIVLHGADYDLRLLRRALNFQPAHLFDTVIAARLLGVRGFSYAALVEKYFSIQLARVRRKPTGLCARFRRKWKRCAY